MTSQSTHQQSSQKKERLVNGAAQQNESAPESSFIDTATDAYKKFTDAKSNIQEEVLSTLKDRMSSLEATVKGYTEKHPYVVPLGAACLGVLIGLSLRSRFSSKE